MWCLGGIELKEQFTRSIMVLILIAIMVMPMARSDIITDNSDAKATSETNRELRPFADPVSPASPEIQYSGDPGGAYSPEPEQAPTGPQTLIVLLVYFSDLSYTESVPTFNSLIFGNVSDYYQEISYGQSSLSGTVAGWYNLGNTTAYYGADGATTGDTDDYDDDGDNDSWRLVDDAISAADPFVNFSSYGHIMVVHAGNGQESSDVSTDIWSVRWSGTGIFTTDEKTFDSASIVPETQYGNVNRIIGVVAHEFGHDIGLPDLYHDGISGSDDLVGIWGLMASGSWGGSPTGTRPTHMTAYSKLMLGWYTDSDVYDLVSGIFEGSLTASSNQTSGLRVIRYNVTSDYYYLVEARYKSGYDESLLQSGILITRVDTTKGSGQGIVQVRSDWIYDLSLGSWTLGEEFVDEVSGFAVTIVSQEGTSFRVRVTTNPLEDWLDENQLSMSGYTDYKNPVMATNSEGILYSAYTVWDTGLGHYTISVMTSDNGGFSWTYGFGFYSETLSYINPSIAIDSYDDMIYITYERTDGATHNIGLARYHSNHTLNGFFTPATDARNPCIAIEYSYVNNYLMLVYEKWTSNTSSVINVDRSIDHGVSWTTQTVQSGDTFNLDPEIVGAYGFDGIQRWHLIYLYGNSTSNTKTARVIRSTDYFSSSSQSDFIWGITLSHPTIAAVRGSPEVFIAFTVNSFETTPSYQHDIFIYYSSNYGGSFNVKSTLYSTTDDEKYPKFAVDCQDYPTSQKGIVYLTYFNGDSVSLRRIYYDRPSVLGAEEVLSTTGYDYPHSIGITTHYTGNHFYPVISWLNDTSAHEVVYSVMGVNLEIGASSPGYPIIINGQSYTCPVTFGLMFEYPHTIEIPDYYYVNSMELMRFDYWETSAGITTSVQNHTSIYMTRFYSILDLKTVTQFLLTVDSAYSTTFGAGWYDSGTTAYVGVNTSSLAVSTGERVAFQYWTDDASGTFYSLSDAIIMDSPKTATAVWDTEYYLTVLTDHGVPSGEGWYSTGSTAYSGLDAGIVAEGSGARSIFQNWTDDTSGTDYSQSNAIVMDGPKTVTAVWRAEYYLTVISAYGNPSGEGWFSIGSTVFAGLDNGTSAVAAGERFLFQSWTDDASGTDPSHSNAIVMDEPKTATATWQRQYFLRCRTYPDSLTPVPTVMPAGDWHDESEIIRLTANEVGGYTFSHWTVDGVWSEAGVISILVVMDDVHIAIAFYQEGVTTDTETTTTETETPPSTPLDGTMTIIIVGAGIAGLVVIIVLKKDS